jgi:hypothetical protein
LCKGGNAVQYQVLAGADHDGSMSQGAKAALAFLAARFTGEAFVPNCADLPRAANP